MGERFCYIAGMSFRPLACGVLALSTLGAFQIQFREYPGVEYRIGDIPLPPDWQEKTEWAFARLMYPPSPYGRYGRGLLGRRRLAAGYGHLDPGLPAR